MPTLKITTQQILPSGQIGALRIDPHINDPVFEAESARGAAIAAVGDAVSGISNSITEFKERKQKLNDRTAISEGERTLRTSLIKFIDSAKTRNDSQNFINEFDSLSNQVKNDILSNEKLSLEGKDALSEIADDFIAFSRIDIGRVASKKDHELAITEFELSQGELIKSGDFDGALANIQDSFSADIIDLARLKKDTDELPQKILFSNVSREIQAAPFRTSEILAANKNLSPENVKRLKSYGDNLFAHEKATNRDAFFTEQERAILSNDFNLEEFELLAQANVEQGYITGKEALKSLRLLQQQDISSRAEDVNTIMLTIENMMILNPEMANEKATELLSLIDDLPTLETKVKYTSLLRKFSALKNAAETEAESKADKTLSRIIEYLDQLEKNNAFGSRTIDINGLDTTDKDFRKATFALVKARKPFFGFGGRTEDEAKEINQALMNELLSQRQADNKLRNEVNAAARLLLKHNPDMSFLEVKAEIDAMISGPSAQKVLRDNLP